MGIILCCVPIKTLNQHHESIFFYKSADKYSRFSWKKITRILYMLRGINCRLIYAKKKITKI